MDMAAFRFGRPPRVCNHSTRTQCQGWEWPGNEAICTAEYNLCFHIFLIIGVIHYFIGHANSLDTVIQKDFPIEAQWKENLEIIMITHALQCDAKMSTIPCEAPQENQVRWQQILIFHRT